jgi:hypothetical protein
MSPVLARKAVDRSKRKVMSVRRVTWFSSSQLTGKALRPEVGGETTEEADVWTADCDGNEDWGWRIRGFMRWPVDG